MNEHELHVSMIGGGIGGLAAACALQRAGVRVTVFERNHELREVGAGLNLGANGVQVLQELGLASEITAVSAPLTHFECWSWRGKRLGRMPLDAIARILREDGIRVLTRTTLHQVEQQSGGHIRLTVHTPEGEQQLTGSHLLGAPGRVPNTEALTPEAAGIHLDQQGYIQVNEQLETNVAGIYALGDVKGGPAFTHVSYDDYRILRTNLLEHGSASTQDRLVPYTIFIDPQLGRVGMSENEARKQGRTIRVAKIPMHFVPRALETGETRGFMKAIVDAETQHILGCAILGVEGGEIMAIIQVAMMGKLPYTALKEGIFTHPTLAEGLNTLFMTLDS